MQRLEKLKHELFSLHNPQLVVTCDEAMHQRLELENHYGVLDLPERPFNPWKGNYELYPVVSQGRSMSTPVAFTCEAFPVASYLNPHAPGLTVAAHILDNKILHPKIREQGGAYGCGATYSPMTGHFTLYSYRDPKIASTLKIFREAVETIAEGHFQDSDLEEAKLETIQHMDVPISPGNRGATAYAWMREGKLPAKTALSRYASSLDPSRDPAGCQERAFRQTRSWHHCHICKQGTFRKGKQRPRKTFASYPCLR